jgi:hypothetical protein
MANIKRYTEKFEASRRAVGFNATAQHISNQRAHAFVAPDLNAIANHNYLPHNGVATIQEFIDGIYEGK